LIIALRFHSDIFVRLFQVLTTAQTQKAFEIEGIPANHPVSVGEYRLSRGNEILDLFPVLD